MELKRKEKVSRHKSKKVKNKHDTGERVKRKQTKMYKEHKNRTNMERKKVKNKQNNRGAQE